MRGSKSRAAFTLLELILVVGLVLLIGALTMPTFFEEMRREEMPTSANQLRSLVALIRANAAFEGRRYRLRFPAKDELEAGDNPHQPIIEREEDPVLEPELYVRVTEHWAIGDTFRSDIRCAEVRLGRPTIEQLQNKRQEAAEQLEKATKVREQVEGYDPDRPPLEFESDGSTDWATFLLTTAPVEIQLEELETSKDYVKVELIVEGATGLAWLQRPFYDEELDLFEEKGWPAVLRKDFLDPRILTENDVLELRDINVRP